MLEAVLVKIPVYENASMHERLLVGLTEAARGYPFVLANTEIHIGTHLT
jgi:hypothetical protein